MSYNKTGLAALMLSALVLCGMAGRSFAQTSASATAGPNPSGTPAQPPIFVDYIPPDASPGMWMLQVDLVVDPNGGPMGKHFESPKSATGAPIQIDAQQPFPQVLWENFLNLAVPGTLGAPITDWHEEIHTPGWEWVLPGDSTFPDLFPAGESLITHDGQPWNWTPIPMDPMDPAKLWVAFPPINPGSQLDIHKALLWVGTDGNRIWGDGRDDAGNVVDESFIDVWEHPTIPEPTAAVLAGMALIGLFGVRRSKSRE
jgi:hypothetical protein